MTQFQGKPWEEFQPQGEGPWISYQQQKIEPIEAPPTLEGEQLQEFIRTSPDALVGDISPQLDTNGFADRLPAQQLATFQPGQNPLRAGKRFAQQLYNFTVADLVDTVLQSPRKLMDRVLTTKEVKLNLE